MIIGYLLVWVVFAVSSSCTNVKKIWCLDENAKSQRNLIKNISQDDMLCKPKIVNDFPWKHTNRTAPAPSELTVNYYLYEVNGTWQIAINITWRQKASYLKYFDAYHLEINFLVPSGHPSQYIMTLDKSLHNQHLFRDVEFRFIYCGRNGNFHIGPNHKYYFSIQGLPLYEEEDDPQRLSRTLKIPGCKDKEISKTAPCVKKSCPQGYKRRGSNCRPRSKKKPKLPSPIETTTSGELAGGGTSGGPNFVIFIIIGAIILIILLALFIFIFFRRRQNDFLQCCMGDNKIPPSDPCNTRVLIIKDIKEDRFSEAIKELLRMFKCIGEIHVTTNAWHTVEIGEQGLVKWTTNEVDKADFVVFLASDHQNFTIDKSEERKSSEDGQDQRVFLNITRNIIHSSKASPEWNHRKFIIADLNNCVTEKNFPYFQHYNLPKRFNKFSKHLLGNLQFNEKNKTIFINLLTNAQHGYGMRSNQGSGVQCVEQRGVSVTMEHNDLDTTKNPRMLNTDREELNIEMDGPPSCENNGLQPYITTDYNNSIDKYHQAGARPKVQC